MTRAYLNKKEIESITTSTLTSFLVAKLILTEVGREKESAHFYSDQYEMMLETLDSFGLLTPLSL
jgi:hypothetical protein